MKKIFDERQERELHKVYKLGFYVLFWGLVAQSFMFMAVIGHGTLPVMSSLILMFAGAAVLITGGARRGIWMEKFKPTLRNHIIAAIAAGLISGPFNAFSPLVQGYEPDYIVGVVTFAITFVFTFILFTALARATKKRAAKLEAEFED